MGLTDRRWAWTEIDLSALAHNVAGLKALTRPGTLFMAVVKADGYGHGSVEIARAAIEAGADRLGVATVDEGIVLRRAGVTAPIHVLSEPPPTSAALVVRHDLTPALYSVTFASALSKAAVAASRTVAFHLKVNTGMNRIGVEWDGAAVFARSLAELPGIAMTGVFTHFATADIPGDWDFERQVEHFEAVIEQLRERGIDPGVVHAANSPATILHPRAHYDMVRCGVAIYGLHPCEASRGRVDLRPVMSVKARVTQVRRITMGDGVSYGLTYRASSPALIATLPLGYADGVRRALSGRLRVLIGGVECRQVGRVCMDQLMVELPRGLEARVGDECVLVGTQCAGTLSIDEQAEMLDTINYEVACGYGARLARLTVRGDSSTF